MSDDGEESLPALYRSVRVMKGHLTRRIVSARKAIHDAGTHPSSDALSDLQKYKLKIQQQYEKIEGCYTEILERLEDEDEIKDFEKELDEENTKADNALSEIRTALGSAPGVARDTPNSRPERGRSDTKVKPNKALEPPKLTRDNTTIEMKSWCTKFRAWYTSSNMSAASIQEQQAYFRMVIDIHLESKLFTSIQQDTPIFGSDSQISCMKLLEDEFLLRYPKIYRQMEFFEAKQAPGELFSDFVSKLRALGDEAALPSLSTEDIYIMRYLTSTSDKKLREEFLKESKPSLRQFDKIVLQYKRAENSFQTTAASKVEANQVQRQPGERGRIPPLTMKELISQKRCTRCGLQTHAAGACQHKESECRICHTKGHLGRVCQSRFKNKPPTKARAVKSEGPEPTGAKEEEPPGYSSDNSEDNTTDVKQVFVRKISDAVGSSRITVQVNGKFNLNACADTGTTASIISHDFVREHKLRLFPATERIFAANGDRMRCEGRTPLKLQFEGINTPVLALVSSDLKRELLIAEKDLKAMRILHDRFPCVLPHVDERVRLVRPTAERGLSALKETLAKDFAEVFSEQLPEQPMNGEPMEIFLKEGATPTRCLTARSIPIHWQKPADEAIKRLLNSGILMRESEPTAWISPGFFVPKGDPSVKEALKKGKTVVTLKDLRLVVDYTGLNRFVERPVHPFPSTKDIIQQLPKDAHFFATLDAVQGYHQIELSQRSSKLTTFLLPSGRYRFLRAPMGLNASSDEWCRRSDQVVAGLEGVQKIVDDVLVSAPTLSILEQRIRKVLTRCEQEHVAISLNKFQIGHTVKFAGHIISSEGVQPDPERIKAISDFPAPTCLKELRSFLGLANQLGSFHPDLAHMTANLRGLLKAGVAFLWLPEHQDEFETVKKLLTKSATVCFFDPEKHTEILTDASRKKGIGFALIQRDGNGKQRLIQCGSRSLTGAEENWATVELEAKAIEYGISKCRHYLQGHPGFEVITDHRPLVPVFCKGMSDTLNVRILRIRERLANFSFVVKWQAGKIHCIADALSRAPVFEPDNGEANEDIHVRLTVSEHPQFATLREAAGNDQEYQEQIDAIHKGEYRQLPISHPARQLEGLWDQLSVLDHCLILLNGSRIYVPRQARKQLLEDGHKSHCGPQKMKELFRRSYYWPGMNNEIENVTRGCHQCQLHLPSLPKEPLQPPSASRPMERIGVDIFDSKGKHYLCIID